MKRALLFCALALITVTQLVATGRVAAQTQPSVTIAIPKTVAVPPETETALPIQLTPEAAVPRQAMVLLRGLTASFILSEGRLFESGVWGVRTTDLAKLKITSLPGAGKTQLSISLVTLDGSVLAQAATSLDVQPTRQVVSATRGIGGTPGENSLQQTSATPAGPSIDKDEEAERLRSGKSALELGDIAAARLIFEYLADHGSADGAYHVALTYDKEALKKFGVVAFKSDEKTAATWYQKAAAMGHPEAQRKISRLTSQ